MLHILSGLEADKKTTNNYYTGGDNQSSFLSMSQMLIRTNGVKDGFTIKEMNRTATLLLLSSLSIKDNRVTNHKHFLLCLPNLFQQKAQLCGILRQGPLKKWTEHFTQSHFYECTTWKESTSDAPFWWIF